MKTVLRHCIFIVAALVYEIKENEDFESSKASIKCLRQKATAVRSVDRVHIDLWDETISILIITQKL